VAAAVSLLLGAGLLGLRAAQDNYEIQVYGARPGSRQRTHGETAYNFTAEGSKTTTDGTLPNPPRCAPKRSRSPKDSQLVRNGFLRFYEPSADGHWYWVATTSGQGSEIPESWHWPVGVSLSNEMDTSDVCSRQIRGAWEIPPIVDRQLGRWYSVSIPRSIAPGMARM
jgi:hypothetical protein